MLDVQSLPTAGLSASEAAARLRADGPNELPRPTRPSSLRRLGNQLVHFFALMLWAAAALAVVAGLPQLSLAIVVVILLNGVFAFVQEHRADRAADRLRDLLPRRITVRRDGTSVQVEATEVVISDVLLLRAGDRVPADPTVTVAHGLLVDTSLLTGESAPVQVSAGEPVHAGSFVVEGEAEAVTTAVGTSTRLAAIATPTSSTERFSSP